jgi:hypothetical protein
VFKPGTSPGPDLCVRDPVQAVERPAQVIAHHSETAIESGPSAN